MRKFCLQVVCLLMFSTYLLSAQSPSADPLVQLQDQLQNQAHNQRDSVRFYTQFVRKNGAVHLSIRDTIIALAKKAKYQAASLNLLEEQFHNTNIIGYLYSIDGVKDSIITYFEASKELAQRLDRDTLNTKFFHLASVAFNNLEQYDSAMHFATKAIKGYERQNAKLQMAQLTGNLAIIVSRANRENSSLSRGYSKKAIEICTDEVDPLFRSKLILNLAVDYGNLEMHDSAFHYINLALQRGIKFKSPVILARAYHQLSEYYLFTDRFEEALKYTDTVQNYTQYLSIHQYNNWLFNRSETLYKLGRYKEAQQIGNQLLERAKSQQTGFLLRDLSKYLYELESKMGNSAKALRHLELHVYYADSLYNLKIAQQVNQLERKFQLAEKEKALAIANQQKAEQALVIQKNSTYFIISILMILGIAIGFIAFQRYQRLKTEKRLGDIQQRLLRSQMNPHFAFNTLGSIQNYLLQSGKSEKAAYYLAKFAKLMRQILNQSRKTFVPLEEEIETVRNYLNLQQLRYEHRFDYDIQLAKELNSEELMIPPMLLQPIIENAIEHGKIYTLESGKVSILIEPLENILKVTVRDNGLGRKATPPPPQLQKNESVATSIILDRIRILQQRYGRKIGFKIQYPERGGAEVFFQLPFIQKT